jgi:cysteine desulfurase/selenocysteine lyase
MCGPTGVGALYGRRELLEAMSPMMGGGSMISRVSLAGVEWNEVPWKFEAGTPPIAEAIGFGAAVDYLGQFDHAALLEHERQLTVEAHRVLEAIDGVRLLGPEPDQKGGIVGFNVEGIHPHDLAQLVDRDGVAIRAGHHCAMPLHERLGEAASARVSFFLYNTRDDITALAAAVERAQRVFRR